MTDVTRILQSIEQGDPTAAAELLPLVYQELRKLAALKMTHEKPGQTMQPTVLVHEAYLRLVDVEQARRWNSRGHFFAAAAESMRRILIENARRKQTERRGKGRNRVDLDAAKPESAERDGLWLALDEALDRLEAQWPEKAQLVKLRYFAGMTVPEAAQAMGVSRATGERYWTFARAWLHAELMSDD
jgi:RNA polymerase sigma factor (TIGR02999 family)